LICILSLGAILVLAPVFANTLTGKVVKVADGDTITVLDNSQAQHRIRLQGIDAPEKGQPFGNASGKHLAGLVAGKTVTVKWDKRDRFRRIVGKVLVDGVDVCLEQIKAGYAWHFKRYQHEQSPRDRQLYTQAEDKARADRLGLWQDKNPVPPWEWRRSHR
jgi:endonuclease YncB( thermonuclease family)